MSIDLPRIRHGIDLVHVPRFREAFGDKPERLARVFTDHERSSCEARADPLTHLAARFAAKEATLKALGLGLSAVGIAARLHEIEVQREAGPPRLVLTGGVERAAAKQGVQASALSLSHDGAYAMASVVLTLSPTAPTDADTSEEGASTCAS